MLTSQSSVLGPQPLLLRPMVTIAEAVEQVTRALEDAGSVEARLGAEVLLMRHADLTRAQLYSHWQEPLHVGVVATLRDSVARRAQGEPLAYVTGHREFFCLDFLVDRRVLIPRPETELLVETALKWLGTAPAGPKRVADVGTGAGAIAVSLAVHCPDALVDATDSSPSALEAARANAQRHGVARRIRMLEGDLLAPLPEPVDLLVANLPYVRDDQLPCRCGAGEIELAWEPLSALAGGPDGLHLIRRFLAQAPRYLRPGGSALLEIGWDQGPPVCSLAQEAFPGAAVSLHKDLAGHHRMVCVRRPTS